MARGRLFVIAHGGEEVEFDVDLVLIQVMRCITSLKCVLTQEHLDAICAKYFVPEEVHPQLPSPDSTMHERPAGKVGMYTRFFDYANYLDEFVVPANARFSWFSGSNIVKDRATAPSEYNVEHVNTLIAQASPFLRFLKEFLCWVGISQMDLNAFIRTADPRKVRIVKRARGENERPIVTVAKHRTVTLLPTLVVRSFGELSASVEREFIGDASVGDGGDQGFDSVGGQDNVEPTVPITEHVETEAPVPKRTKKKRVIRGSERTPVVSHPPKRLRADYGATGGSATGGKSPSVLNRLLQDSRFMVEQGVPALPTLPFITSSALNLRILKFDSLVKVLQFPAKLKSCYSCYHNCLLGARDKEIEELKSQLLKANEESVEVAQLRARVSGLEATEGSLRGEVASAKEHNGLLEQECGSLKLKVTSLESTIAEKDRELSDLGASSSSLKSQNQSLVNQVHELETSSTDLREKLEMYEGSLKRLEEFQDNLMRPLETRLAEIDADFTRCCMRFQESFHPHLLNVVAGRRWLLTHGMKLLMAKCLNSTEYMEALGHAFGRAIEKGMQEGLAARIEHGQAGRCLTDLEAYIPSAEVDFNSAVRDLRDLNFPLLQELSNKKDASTWDIMDLLRLDDAVAEALGMTDLQPDVSQLMVPVHHKQDRVVIGSQALSVALDICRGRVEKMERNLVERLPFLKDVFVSLDHPLSAEALIEPPVEVPATNVLSTVVIVPHSGPSVSVEDYENPDLVDVVPKNVTPGPEGEENIDAATGGDLAFSKLDDEARDAVL
ncbi:hypothetical protein Tco_0409823 [Tanacetum coccineum]